MIPNSLASTGAYAGFWSFLKASDHALGRLLSTSSAVALTPFDRERIMALADFMEECVEPPGEQRIAPPDLIRYMEANESDYSAALDLRAVVCDLPEFAQWQEKQRLGYEKKMGKLIRAARDAVNSSGLFMENAVGEECEILQAIVRALLTNAEVSLRV